MIDAEREALIEKMARAIACHDADNPSECLSGEWCEENWICYRPEAVAAYHVLRARIAERDGLLEENEKLKEALLFAELMASEMRVDPSEKCQRIYDELYKKRRIEREMTMSDDITGGLDLLGDWLDAKGYTEEAGLCTRAMDEINKLRTAVDLILAYDAINDEDALEDMWDKYDEAIRVCKEIREIYGKRKNEK